MPREGKSWAKRDLGAFVNPRFLERCPKSRLNEQHANLSVSADDGNPSTWEHHRGGLTKIDNWIYVSILDTVTVYILDKKQFERGRIFWSQCEELPCIMEGKAAGGSMVSKSVQCRCHVPSACPDRKGTRGQ